ncbi:Intraflagellar transport protein 88 [Tetrabaena socialis]|uniref:Intraflagellar transport protein 88 n=1 Tax=Tetrabaena socialis TaxID=47790 RepID=A0A2J8AE88_9CHLO|nr:Intraflagellar transport protein 88 [Tetrabaena socialis]|eukprot:PNH10841.1 Intraflagellar transport protein 88 [Tetrabaena socialis]
MEGLGNIGRTVKRGEEGESEFEKKEPRVKARAATNLAFLYFLEGEVDQADKYSEMALKSDRYNARAFVNKGCVLTERGDLEGARSLFNEAAGIDPYCVEAIFNLGLVSQRLSELPYALAAFKKLHNMVPDNVEVVVTEATLAAVEAARAAGRSTWRVSSTVFTHCASDATLMPLGRFASQPGAAEAYPPTRAGEQVQQELEAICLRKVGGGGKGAIAGATAGAAGKGAVSACGLEADLRSATDMGPCGQ